MTGQMIESMGQIKRQLARRAAQSRKAFGSGSLRIDHELRGRGLNPRDSGIRLRDHIGLLTNPKAPLFIGGHAGIIRQNHGQFTEREVLLSQKRPPGQPLNEQAERGRIQRQRLLPVEDVNLHGDRDSFHAGYSSMKTQRRPGSHSDPPA